MQKWSITVLNHDSRLNLTAFYCSIYKAKLQPHERVKQFEKSWYVLMSDQLKTWPENLWMFEFQCPEVDNRTNIMTITSEQLG